MSYDCPNCGKPIPTQEEWLAHAQLGLQDNLNQQIHRCDAHVTAETIRRIVREEIRAALGKEPTK